MYSAKLPYLCLITPRITFISIDQLQYTLYRGSDGNIAVGANILAIPLD